MSKFARFFDVLSTVVVVIASIAVLWRMFGDAPAVAGRTEPAMPTGLLSLTDVPLLGLPAAPVVMVQFSDFQCSFCSHFATQTFPHLREKYIDSGILKTSFRHLPLSYHPRAAEAARTAECARTQGSFWTLHNLMFASGDLATTDFRSLASSAGVNHEGFEACVTGGAAAVQRDQELAKRLQITSTPTFVFGVSVDGGVRITDILKGAQPLTDFEQIINRLRKQSF